MLSARPEVYIYVNTNICDKLIKANDCGKGPYGHICDTQDRKIPRSSKICQGKCTHTIKLGCCE